MPTIHFVIILFNAVTFLLLLMAVGLGAGYLNEVPPAIVLLVLAILFYPLPFGLMRRYLSWRCPGCKNWFVRVKYREGERGGLLLGRSWYPRWVIGHYTCSFCGHEWTRTNRLPTGADGAP